MFGTILISVITVLHIYVFWRAASVPLIVRHVSIGREYGHGGTGTLAAAVEFFGMTWMGVLFLLFVSILALDIVTGFGFIFPRFAPWLRGWALLIGGVLSATALVQGLRPPVIQSYEVRLPGLLHEMDGSVLVAISDLHIGSLIGERWLSARIAQVRAERPDLICLIGDIFEGHGPSLDKLVPVLRRMSAPLGVWAVTGNHELHRRNNRGISLMKEAGIQLLRNRWVEVRSGFILAGVDDLTSQRRAGSVGDPVSRALSCRPPGATIFLSHTPWEAGKAANAGAALMLSGHTHGGQIWPFGYLVSLMYPLLAGRYEVAGMPVIVTRGAGTWGPRMRLWHAGEIIRVTLKRI